jgi:hypothetical protein
LWSDGYPVIDTNPFTNTLAEPMSINVWVEQQ